MLRFPAIKTLVDVSSLQWRSARYQDRPEHHAFRQLLAAPLEDAKAILEASAEQFSRSGGMPLPDVTCILRESM